MAKQSGETVRDDAGNENDLFQPVKDPGEQAAYTQMFQDTWQQNLGRQGEVRQEQPELQRVQAQLGRDGVDRRQAAEQQGRGQDNPAYHDVKVGNYTVRMYNQGGYVDVLNGNGSRVTRGRMDPDKQELRLRIPNETLHIDTRTHTVERRDLQGRKFEAVHTDGARDNFNEQGRLATRTFPDGVKDIFDNAGTRRERRFPDGPQQNRPYEGGSYERYDEQGRVSETNFDGVVTKFDAQGRQTEVKSRDGKQWKFAYGADGRVSNYELNDKGNVTERGQRAQNGAFAIERKQSDGTFKQVDALKDRADVILRPDLKMDYLDRDGYSAPDAAGRRIKRDARTMMSPTFSDRGPSTAPVNPIRSIRAADGSQVDYTYASDGRQGGPDELNSYTVRKDGKVVEFAHRVPAIPGDQQRAPVWLEFKNKPGQPPMSDTQVNDVRRLLAPGTPEEMLARQRELVQQKPLKDYIPDRSPMSGAFLDQFTGRQVSQLSNNDKIVRDYAGGDYTLEANGDKVVRQANGKEVRTAADANPNKPGDRTTITELGPNGRPRLKFHHARSDGAHVLFNYGSDGKISEFQTDSGGLRTKIARGNNDVWTESKLVGVKDGKESWEPTGNTFKMQIDLVGDNSPLRAAGQKLPVGSVVLTHSEPGKPPGRRIFTANGQELFGRAVGDGYNDTIFPQRQQREQADPRYDDPRYRQDPRYAPRQGEPVQQGDPRLQNRQQGQRPRPRM